MTLTEEKTKLIPFGGGHWLLAQSYPHHFDFLGFGHHLGTERNGRMAVIRIPSPNVKEWLRKHRHG